MTNANITGVLRSFPEFRNAHQQLKELVRENINWACDGLDYFTDGTELFDENCNLLVVPLNDIYSLVAVEFESELGFQIIVNSDIEE